MWYNVFLEYKSVWLVIIDPMNKNVLIFSQTIFHPFFCVNKNKYIEREQRKDLTHLNFLGKNTQGGREKIEMGPS